MTYFRAMCYKQVNRLEECSQDYQTLRAAFTRNMNRDLVKYVFGLILLPLQENRKVSFR